MAAEYVRQILFDFCYQSAVSFCQQVLSAKHEVNADTDGSVVFFKLNLLLICLLDMHFFQQLEALLKAILSKPFQPRRRALNDVSEHYAAIYASYKSEILLLPRHYTLVAA